jgi:YVTN family beta-propeller protein
MSLVRSVSVPCAGLNHADFNADLTTMLVSCEFSGQLVFLDADAKAITSVLDLNAIVTPGATSPAAAPAMGGPKARLSKGASAMPQDVRLSPDGRSFLVADMLRNGVWVIDVATAKQTGFIPTGMGAHAVYPSRDARHVYVSNRDEGTVTVLDATTLTPTTTWTLPKGASPDMGGVTADGSQLWLSGRYSAAVYVIDTTTGQTIKTIPTRPGPHGLLVWPQPGRISLGHTGNMR